MATRNFTEKEIFHPDFLVDGYPPWAIRPQIIWDKLDALRDAWGKPIFINRPGLNLVHCGMRPIECRVGAKLSRHKPIYSDVQAFDLSCKDTPALWSWIIDAGWSIGNVERVEDRRFTPNWCHIEISTKTPESVYIFIP